MARKEVLCLLLCRATLTSIMALSRDESAAQSDLQASLVVAFEEVFRIQQNERAGLPGRSLEETPCLWLCHGATPRRRTPSTWP